MKYYKRIDSTWNTDYKQGSIYKETDERGNSLIVKKAVLNAPGNWKEVSELEYYEQEGYLPEGFKWCIRTLPSTRKKINSFIKGKGYGFSLTQDYYIHYPFLYDTGSSYHAIMKNYTEITYSQFKRLVLKQKDVKEIIGYKLKNKKYFESVKALSAGMCFGAQDNPDVVLAPACSHTKFFKKEKVLDLWFEPVYANSTPDITINGYKAEFFDNYIKFGCAEISKEVFIDLHTCREYSNTNRDVESATIGKGTFTKEHIKQIAEYYNNK